MGITRQQVQSAIQTLTEQGKTASIRAIRAYLGAGSLSTIQKYIQPQSTVTEPLWNADLSRLMQEVSELREEVKRLGDMVLCNTVTPHDAKPNEPKPNTNQTNEIIRQSYRDGLTTAMIADRLNGQGILTSRGNQWTVDIVGHYAKRHRLKP